MATVRATVPGCWRTTGVDPADVVGHRHRLHRVHDAADHRRRHAAVRRAGAPPRAPRLGEALEASRGPARGGPDQRAGRGRAASRGSPATAGGSRRSGSIAKASRSSTRRRTSTRAADRLIEAADWIVWQLTGDRDPQRVHRRLQGHLVEARTASRDASYFGGAATRARVHRRRQDVARRSTPIGARAGGLSAEAAGWTGLRPGTPVAVANVDAHVSVPAVGVTEPGTMVAVMGTSTCHLVLGDRLALAEGMCGVVEDGIVPGLLRVRGRAVGRRRHLRAGSSTTAVPPDVHEAARRDGSDVHARARARRGARCGPARPGSWPSTGGTATARSSSTWT